MLKDVTGSVTLVIDELYVQETATYLVGQYLVHFNNSYHLLVVSEREIALFRTVHGKLELLYAGDGLAYCVSEYLQDDVIFQPITINNIEYTRG